MVNIAYGVSPARNYESHRNKQKKKHNALFFCNLTTAQKICTSYLNHYVHVEITDGLVVRAGVSVT